MMSSYLNNMNVEEYPLHAAARGDDADLLWRMLSLLPDHEVNQVTFDMVTPLHEACLAGSAACVQVLLKHGARVNARNIDGASPLCNACHSGSMECVVCLLAHGAEVNPSLNLLTSPLHEAVANDHHDVMRVLLAAGARLETSDLNEGTPLHVAAHKNSPVSAHILLSAGADVNSARNHMTALHKAAEHNSLELATVLMEFGANIYAENLWKYSARDIVGRMHGDSVPLYAFLQFWEANPRSLMEIARQKCRCIFGCRVDSLKSLRIPSIIQRYILHAVSL